MKRLCCALTCCAAAVVSVSSWGAESVTQPRGGEERSVREALSKEALNVAAWALSGLDEPIPHDIRRNLAYLREDLLDEAKSATTSNAVTYKIGDHLCGILLDALDEHDQVAVRAGYRIAQGNVNPNMKVTSPDLEARRYWKFMMYWPQYYRERDQRNEIQRQVNNKGVLINESVRVDWANRTAASRRNIDWMYGKFREALRQDPVFRSQANASRDVPQQATNPPAAIPRPMDQVTTAAETPVMDLPPEMRSLFTLDFAALPADERINQVKAAFMKMNGGMTTKVRFGTNKNGVKAWIHGKAVTNLWPLCAIPDLYWVNCVNTGVSDLSPLAGYVLKGINCSRSGVVDLSSLRGAKVEWFKCANTKVADLSPLRGMPLKTLTIVHTQVTDLSPLKDLPILEELYCDVVPSRDSEILRSLKTLKTINGKPVKEFWMNPDEGKMKENDKDGADE